MKTCKKHLEETKAASEDAMQWADDYMKARYTEAELEQMEQAFDDWFKKVQSNEDL